MKLLEEKFIGMLEGNGDNNCNQSIEEIPKCVQPWTYCDNGTCKCGNEPRDGIKCDLDAKSLMLKCYYCITYNKYKQTTEIGRCIFGVVGITDNILCTMVCLC